MRGTSLGWALGAVVVWSCSSSESGVGAAADAGREDGTTAEAGGGGEASPNADASDPGGPVQTESEPNDGKEVSGTPQTNAMTIPGTMTGAIDPADDSDIFTVKIAPGELWHWEIASAAGSPYVPELTVFDISPNNQNPTMRVHAAAKGSAPRDYFVLHGGKFVVALRDGRNVPVDSSAHAGGAEDKYTLVATKIEPQATAVTFPKTVSASLAGVSSLAFYKFHATKDLNVEIVLKAARKSSPSELDSRMSLFDITANEGIITNDDADGATPDSEIRGPMPHDGDYLLMIEHEAEATYDPNSAPDLSYELSFKTN